MKPDIIDLDGLSRTVVMLTAAEAFPALEHEFMSAKREIWASFRIFDLTTRLRSPEALRLGDTWFDLVIDVLRRGVAIRVIISDFDPIVRPNLHRDTWSSVRMFHAAADLAGPTTDLKVVPSSHPARTGFVPRIAVWPAARWRLSQTASELNALPKYQRDVNLRDMPGLARYLRIDRKECVRPRALAFPDLIPATHHQKLSVFDRSRLVIGGLDLDERRFDDPDHERPSDETWADVQILTEQKQAVMEAQHHLENFRSIVSGLRAPQTTGVLLRTLSRKRSGTSWYFGPKPIISEIATMHRSLAKRTRRLIYLETQFFRDRGLARSLAEAARRNAELSLILMLPAAPEDIAFNEKPALDVRMGEFLQSRCLRLLRRAFRERMFVGTGAQPRSADGEGYASGRDRLYGARIVYIHSKVSIFDSAAAIVSSANLNARSLRWDTEAGILLETPETVRSLRERIFDHWLPKDAGPEFYDDATAVAAWHDLARANREGSPEERAGLILPYDMKAGAADGLPMPIIPDEMV